LKSLIAVISTLSAVSTKTERLETQFHAEPDLAFTRRRRNDPERRTADRSTRVPELRRISDAESLRAKLELHPLADCEGTEDARIQVEDSGTTQNIAAGITKRRRSHGGKCSRIEIWVSWSIATQDGHRRQHLIRSLRIAWRMERRCRGADREWRPALTAKNPVGLPAAGDCGSESVIQHALAFSEWKHVVSVDLKVVGAVIPGERVVPVLDRRPLPCDGARRMSDDLSPEYNTIRPIVNSIVIDKVKGIGLPQVAPLMLGRESRALIST
jgi:hypothetical protein